MPLEEPRRLVGHSPAAKVRMDGEPAELGDAVRAAAARKAHDARALVVDLDHEHAEELGLLVRAGNVGAEALAVRRATGREKGLDVVAAHEVGHEVEVVRPRTAHVDVHNSSSAVFGRRPAKTTPEPSATPPRIRPRPTIIAAVTGSSRNAAPYPIANTGMTYATSEIRRFPYSDSMRKNTSWAIAVPR